MKFGGQFLYYVAFQGDCIHYMLCCSRVGKHSLPLPFEEERTMPQTLHESQKKKKKRILSTPTKDTIYATVLLKEPPGDQ